MREETALQDKIGNATRAMKRHYAEEATELQLGEVLVTLRSSARCWQIYRVHARACARGWW